MDTQQATDVTVFSHKTVEYYTPAKYIEAAREVMGGIDTDPASCDFAQGWIKADTYFTKEDDGLSKSWYGSVWLNPPYGVDRGRSRAGTWAEKLEAEIEAGAATVAILLVKAALGYIWFERLFHNYPVCFTRDRIRFYTKDGRMPAAKQANAFFLLETSPSYGPYLWRFQDVFGKFGRVILPLHR